MDKQYALLQRLADKHNHNCLYPRNKLIPSHQIAVNCGAPSEIQGGGVSTPDGTMYQATITYFCNSGSALQGSPIRTCQGSGTWSGSEPTCDGEAPITSS